MSIRDLVTKMLVSSARAQPRERAVGGEEGGGQQTERRPTASIALCARGLARGQAAGNIGDRSLVPSVVWYLIADVQKKNTPDVRRLPPARLRPERQCGACGVGSVRLCMFVNVGGRGPQALVCPAARGRSV